MKKAFTAALICLLVPFIVIAQTAGSAPSTPPFSLGASGAVSTPSPLDDNSVYFALGGSPEIFCEYVLPFFPLLYLKAAVGYGIQTLAIENEWLHFISGSAGLGIRIPLASWLTFKTSAEGGYYNVVLTSWDTGAGEGNAFFAFTPSVSFNLTPSLSLGVGAAYRLNLNLVQSISGVVSMSFIPGAAGGAPAQPIQKAPDAGTQPLQPLKSEAQSLVEESGKALQIHTVAMDSIFPIFHTYYDDHPIGKLTLKNTANTSASNVTVSLIIKQFMDAPKECATLKELKAGESKDVDLFALFKSSILEVTQATKVAAEIAVSYSQEGKQSNLSKVETVRVYDRNAMTWDDDRKAAAFVTSKEPVILTFSNNVNASLKGNTNRAVDQNLQTAMALHDALRAVGIAYVSNPLTPYSVTSKDKLTVDTLKFPRQTFEYRSGDCSDLSILYSALMESVQIETAFITIPGHIFMAFALKSTPEEARAAFTQTDELIFKEGKVWVPVEVTEREGTFLTAWQQGAKEWRENLSKSQVGFFPIHDAWKLYEPVGLPGSGSSPTQPDMAKVLKDFQDDLSHLIDREIYGRVAQLLTTITKTQESAKSVNALGVLYARYDLSDKAEKEFKRALTKSEYVPALVNLGNLYFLKNDMEKAISFYDRAYKKAPQDPKVLLAVARANHQVENYYMVKKTYDELKKADPDLASRFAYLELKGEEATRAAEVGGVKETMVWSEE